MPKIFQLADELVWKSSRNNVCALTSVRFSAIPPPIIKATSDLGRDWFIVRLQSWFLLVVRLFCFDHFRPETNPVASAFRISAAGISRARRLGCAQVSVL